MKVLHLEIESCEGCPYLYSSVHVTGECMNPDVDNETNQLSRKEIKSTPEWCPLPEKESLK